MVTTGVPDLSYTGRVISTTDLTLSSPAVSKYKPALNIDAVNNLSLDEGLDPSSG